MTTQITTVEVDSDDFADELAYLERTIFGPDALTIACFGVQKEESGDSLAHRASRIRMVPPGSTNRAVKAVDADGKTVGAAFWNLRHEPWIVKDVEKESKVDPARYPPGANLEACEAVFGPANRNRIRHMNGKCAAMLSILVVKPECQRQGVGSLLLQEGLRKVDELGLPMWLSASSKGLGLYLKNGFEIDEQWLVDLRPYGQDVVETQTAMLRAPHNS